MRILYVEDHPANLFLVQRVARMGNHDIINYTEGQSALDHFEADKPDLVLMDVQLPGKLTGLDVVRELRSRGHKLPIIAVTAYAMMGDRERCLEAGCDGYIAKPMPISDLVEILKKFDPTESLKEASSQAAAPSTEASTPSEPPTAETPSESSTPAEAKAPPATESRAEKGTEAAAEKPSEGSTSTETKAVATTESSAEKGAAETPDKPSPVPVDESPVEATVKKLEAS